MSMRASPISFSGIQMPVDRPRSYGRGRPFKSPPRRILGAPKSIKYIDESSFVDVIDSEGHSYFIMKSKDMKEAEYIFSEGEETSLVFQETEVHH